MAIHFHIEPPLTYPLRHRQALKAWLKAVVNAELEGSKQLGTLNYILCTDDYLHQLNVSYLQHDTLTDIITFDTSEDEHRIAGDLFISVERVKDNAADFGVPTETELRRVMVHGLLHLLGYTDETDEQEQTMRAKEDAYLSMINC